MSVITKFTKTVNVYELDAQGNRKLGPDKLPVVLRPLGTFTFRRPGYHDRNQIALRMEALIGWQTQEDGTQELNLVTGWRAYNLEMEATLPYQAEGVPDDWGEWDAHENEEWWAVNAAYKEGMAELAGKNGKQGA